MHQRSGTSLRLLSAYLARRSGLAEVRAIGSDTAGFLTSRELDSGLELFARFGFEVLRPQAQASIWRCLTGF